MRLIDADALMETLKIMREKNKAELDDSIETSLIVIGIQEAYCSAIEAVQDAPTIEAGLEKRNVPVKVRHLHNAKVTMHEEVTFTDECGNCGGYLVKNWKACPLCGQAVKWE